VIRRLRSLPPLETVLALIAIAVLALATSARERGSQPVAQASHSSYDAAANGYRALYELLTREGTAVERFERRPAFLGDADVDTLVEISPLPFEPALKSQTAVDAAALGAWVRGGGNVLYIGDAWAGRSADNVLAIPAATGLRRHPGGSTIDPALRRFGVAAIASHVSQRWQQRKGRPFRALLDDGRGPLVIRYRLGRGEVTALIDQSLLSNDGIARGDRARLGYALALPRARNGLVAFDEVSHGHLVPEHWWSVVPRPFAIALGIALVVFLIALAGAAVRLGPPLVPRPADQRSTADFIDGLSALFERGHAVHKALRDASNSARRTVARGLGLGDETSNEEIATRIDREDLRAAFREMVAIAENPSSGEQNLVRGVALAGRLRKEYAAHGRPRH